MNECCEIKTPPRRYRCPVNGREYRAVGIKTMLHHLLRPWKKTLSSQAYYFCTDPACDVVYFGRDDSVINRDEVRTTVGIKEALPDSMLCYCFGISYSEAAENSKLKSFVKKQTGQSLCSCETSNPSGRCCLKDFPEH